MSRVMSKATKIAMAMFLFCFSCGAYANSIDSNHKYLDNKMQNTPTDNLLSDGWDNGNRFNAYKNSIAVNVGELKEIVCGKADSKNAKNKLENLIPFVKVTEDSKFAEVKGESTAGHILPKATFTNCQVYNKGTPNIDYAAVKLAEDKVANFCAKEREKGIQEVMFNSDEKRAAQNVLNATKWKQTILAEKFKNQKLGNFAAEKKGESSKFVLVKYENYG